MDKQSTLDIINGMLDESYKTAKENAEKILNSREWDFDQFGDRNTFARAVFECIMENEKNQYRPLLKQNDHKYNTKVRQLEGSVFYELCGI